MSQQTEAPSPRDVVFSFFQTKGSIGGTTEAEQRAFDYVDGALLDSFGIVEMVTEFEARFEIKFSTDDLQSPGFRTIGGLIEIIERLRT
jgi:acyl carrier protein